MVFAPALEEEQEKEQEVPKKTVARNPDSEEASQDPSAAAMQGDERKMQNMFEQAVPVGLPAPRPPDSSSSSSSTSTSSDSSSEER